MEKPKKRRWWILIVIIILLLSCILVALYLLSHLQVASSPLPPTPAQLTTEMKIVISTPAIKPQNGTADAFVVLANTDLTVQSNDTNDHTCLISGSGIQPISIQLKGGKASSPFKLPVGVYQLTCDTNPKRILVITAQ